MAVIEGDIETERDAERIRARGIPAWQITTGGACHLEAKMIGRVLAEVPADLDFLFIENVGNLVCPASYDLGESLRFVLLSSPEGDDKPKKYPEAFLSSQVLVLTKSDLIPYLPFERRPGPPRSPGDQPAARGLRRLGPDRRGDGRPRGLSRRRAREAPVLPCMSCPSSPACSTSWRKRPGKPAPSG